MPAKTKSKFSISGFSDLEAISDRRNKTSFSQLNSLRVLSILPTPPDNEVVVRFLMEDFAMIRVHRWVNVGERRRNVLCPRTVDRSADCEFCDREEWPSNRGVIRVAVVDNKDKPVLEDFEGSANDRAEYLKFVDESKLVQNGDKLKIVGVPKIRILDMGKSFWDQMNAFYKKYGTICDRSYTVYRMGEDLNTRYQVVPSDKDPEFKSVELLQMQFEPGLDFCMDVDSYVEFLGRPIKKDDKNEELPDKQEAAQNSLQSMLS